MASTASPTAPVEAEPRVRPDTVPRERTEVKRQPQYAVVLHNDDVNGMDHVVRVLRKVFHHGRAKAIWLMLKAHFAGQVMVWTGSLEVAELKADQVRSCGPDPNMKQFGATTLQVSVEPLPD
jgi:ATP-dependent Clp protease adaptor protein ClpS